MLQSCGVGTPHPIAQENLSGKMCDLCATLKLETVFQAIGTKTDRVFNSSVTVPKIKSAVLCELIAGQKKIGQTNFIIVKRLT